MLLRQAEFWDKAARRDRHPIPNVPAGSAPSNEPVTPGLTISVYVPCESPGLRVLSGWWL
jgi:hypothetical protein